MFPLFQDPDKGIGVPLPVLDAESAGKISAHVDGVTGGDFPICIVGPVIAIRSIPEHLGTKSEGSKTGADSQKRLDTFRWVDEYPSPTRNIDSTRGLGMIGDPHLEDGGKGFAAEAS